MWFSLINEIGSEFLIVHKIKYFKLSIFSFSSLILANIDFFYETENL